MKVNLFRVPPPLTIGAGEDAFQLQLKSVRDSDRMELIGALVEQDFAKVQESINGLIINWSGVLDENGSPIPFKTMDENEKPKKNISAFFGCIPLRLQCEAMLAVLAMLGLKHHAEFIARVFGELIGGGFELAFITPPAVSTPGTASGGSSASAT